MDDDLRAALIAEHLDAEAAGPERYFWLSFVAVTGPGCPKSLGATVVRARGPLGALREARARGVNPGGEVQVVEFDGDGPGDAEIIAAMLNKLLSRDEIMAAGIKLG
jgi:hypothetical protein